MAKKTNNHGTNVRQYYGADKLFIAAWSLAITELPKDKQCGPTHRQYAKWKQGRGLAYNKLAEARAALAGE